MQQNNRKKLTLSVTVGKKYTPKKWTKIRYILWSEEEIAEFSDRTNKLWEKFKGESNKG